MEDKKEQVAYEAPKVIDYGTVVDLTRAASEVNRDTPTGNNNTAFPPAS